MIRIIILSLLTACLTCAPTAFNDIEAIDTAFGHIDFTIAGSTVSGTVTLPASGNVTRNFRGRAYRNRGGASSSASTSKSENNPLEDTIISLHPVSFEADVTPPVEAAVINQENAEFVPHVTAVLIGSVVEFINNDSFYHNVFSLTPGAKFNIGRRPTGDIYTKTIPKTQWVVEGLGEIQLFCDIHSQMNAVILSLDTPYFTRADENGFFSIGDLPAGTYELRGYNPRFEVESREVTLDGDSSVDVDFNFIN